MRQGWIGAWPRFPPAPANELAQGNPARAHAVLKALPDGGYAVSVRAPHATLHGAVELAREFGGGGRATAAGIDRLPVDQLPRFVARLAASFRA